MKKWITIGLLVVVVAAAIMAGVAFVGVQANDSALEEIRSQEGVITLSVSGMT